MTGQPLLISCVGMTEGLGASLLTVAESAGRALDLACDVSGIRICGDDLPGRDDAWYRLEPAAAPEERPILVMFCHRGSFGPRERARESLKPPPAIWEQSRQPEEGAGGLEEGYSAERSAIFLHHHLLTARDLIRKELEGRKLSAVLTEAFAEAWSVRVDGRLARQGLPGYSLAERRGRFAGVFSPAGILLPDHWQVFQSIWDGAISSQKDILEVIKRLPGL